MVLAPLLVLGSLAWMHTQSDTSARISGRAVSAYNGRPLAGVTVAVTAAERLVVTDSTGVFSLADLPVGRQVLHIAYDGRDAGDYEFVLRQGRTMRLSVVLDAKAPDLAPLISEMRFVDIWRDLAGFYERRRQYAGFARFITREDIDREHPQTISTLLKEAGIFTWCVYTCMPTRFSRGRVCAVPVSVNGLPVWARDVDRIPIDNVAGVEIYRDPGTTGPFGLPMVNQFGFEGSDVSQGRRECGSVGIWTR